MGPQIFGSQKYLKKNLGPKKFESKKVLGKTILGKNNVVKNNFSPKKFESKKIICPK